VERKADSSWYLLLHSTVALLAPVILVTLIALFAPKASPGRRLLATADSTTLAAGVGVATAALLGALLNDSGVAVFVAAGCVTVPILLASLAAPQELSATSVREHMVSDTAAGPGE
jgi:hypothetical protein